MNFKETNVIQTANNISQDLVHDPRQNFYLDFPSITDHQIEVGVIVNICTHTCVVVEKLLLSDLKICKTQNLIVKYLVGENSGELTAKCSYLVLIF